MRLCETCGKEIRRNKVFHLQCYKPPIDIAPKETRKPTRYVDRIKHTELGKELTCVRCLDDWPADPEFYSGKPGKEFSYCKACETETQAERRERERRTKDFIKSFGKMELRFEIANQ